jgi:hypothetical protein
MSPPVVTAATGRGAADGHVMQLTCDVTADWASRPMLQLVDDDDDVIVCVTMPRKNDTSAPAALQPHNGRVIRQPKNI